jgi:hypothetical protein
MPASKHNGLLSRYTAYAVLPAIAHAALVSKSELILPAFVGVMHQQGKSEM